MVLTSSPPENTFMVGIEVMPYEAAIWGFSSVFTFTILILSAYSAAISSKIGATWRQGPHQGAQKATRTGLSALRTSASKVASVARCVWDILTAQLNLGRRHFRSSGKFS